MRCPIRLFLTISCLSFLAGCSGPDSPPSGILSREKMQQVLWDMIEADQYTQLFLSRDSAKIDVKAVTAGHYEQIFLLYKTTRKQFDKSIQFYFSRPDIAKPLFDSLSVMGIRKRTEQFNHNPGNHSPVVNSSPVPPINSPNRLPGTQPNHLPGTTANRLPVNSPKRFPATGNHPVSATVKKQISAQKDSTKRGRLKKGTGRRHLNPLPDAGNKSNPK